MEDTTRIELEKALAKRIITQAQFDALVAGLSESDNNSIIKTPASVNPTYRISLNILLCFFIIMLIVFISRAAHFLLDYFVGKSAILAIPIFYFILFTISGNYFWYKNLKVYANIFYIASFSIIPYLFADPIAKVVYELSYNRNDSEFSWIYIITTFVTVLGGLIYWYFRRSLLLIVPIVFNTWLLSMAILPILFGQFRNTSSEEFSGVTFCFGLIFIIFSVCQEKKNKQKYLQWLYVFGCFVFYETLYLFRILYKHSDAFWWIMLGVFLVGMGIAFKRRLFTILAWVWLILNILPYLFSVLGFLFVAGVILIYVLYDKKPDKIEKILPLPIKKMFTKSLRKDDSND
jgi:hypothetical protein